MGWLHSHLCESLLMHCLVMLSSFTLLVFFYRLAVHMGRRGHACIVCSAAIFWRIIFNNTFKQGDRSDWFDTAGVHFLLLPCLMAHGLCYLALSFLQVVPQVASVVLGFLLTILMIIFTLWDQILQRVPDQYCMSYIL